MHTQIRFCVYGNYAMVELIALALAVIIFRRTYRVVYKSLLYRPPIHHRQRACPDAISRDVLTVIGRMKGRMSQSE